ncbi:hypothetical protein J5N97_018000 [Dioscorea zingiberensis]|uniref:Uncharacterized protein n=1 Tax=Dioscorea zingiberensis TaxID=325984 RepID=A0A9D5HGX0_9LILI|nr:hypothetical protein J5N97_018000 [Dioscorea zingiberensis]
MDIAMGSIDLLASPGRIKQPAECHMDTIADVFTLDTDKPHSCLNVETVESNGHILSSENKKEILLKVCKYAPAPSGSHSSDATPCVNSACMMNESNVSVIHKVQCTIGGGLIEDANKKVPPRIRIVDKEPNSAHAGRDVAGQFPLNINMYLPQESFVCDDVGSDSTCSSEAKLEGTSQDWSSEPVASPDSVIDSCHVNNIRAHMNFSTSFSTGENEVDAMLSVTDTNQPLPVEDVGDKTGHKGDAVSKPKRIEDCEKETLKAHHEVIGKNTSDGSPKPGNKVLKSVAGGITLVGAAFLFLHFRGRRGRVPAKSPETSQECSKNKGVDHGKQDVQDLAQRPSRTQETKHHKGSIQKQEEKGRPKVFYPGGKLKL